MQQTLGLCKQQRPVFSLPFSAYSQHNATCSISDGNPKVASDKAYNLSINMKLKSTEVSNLAKSTIEKPTKNYDVIVVGNGPAGIFLSYLLSGNWPYYNGKPHPEPLLHDRLNADDREKSIIEQNLEDLSDGLYDSRSPNPVSVLFDQLYHPNADLISSDKTVLDWKFNKKQVKKHLVLGLGPAGGSWHRMTYSQLTLSLGNWLELPGYSYKEWLKNHNSLCCGVECCNLPQLKREPGTHRDRTFANHVALYYSDYIKTMNLDKNFSNDVLVTSVEPSGINSSSWTVKGIRLSAQGINEPICLTADNVVLAVGAYHKPRTLGIPGENMNFVHYGVPSADQLPRSLVSKTMDPVVVVGCGLVALDACLLLIENKIPVLHVFRRDVKDTQLIVNQLPSSYCDYIKLKPYMTNKCTHPYYTALPRHKVVEILPSKSCIIEHVSGQTCFEQNVSAVMVQIGSKPNLSLMGNINDLAVDPSLDVDIKKNPIDVDIATYESSRYPGLYAVGPVVGDNFVRFILGGALGVIHGLASKTVVCEEE